ncbi:MAG: hypothetical protein LHV68_07750 [Elusimicrobia bacterium]|nr:hypothetical protein [Candidatus Liberimonas magnetica]
MKNIIKNQFLSSSSGSALIIAIIIMVIIGIMIPVGLQIVEKSFKEARYQEYTVSEAGNVARAGIEDAILWFRRQSNQPVRTGVPLTADYAFDPRVSSATAKYGTIDESIGLVKEERISMDNQGVKFARYEVKRQTASVSYDDFAVHDISNDRILSSTSTTSLQGQGIVWFLASKGYIYLRRDASVPYNQPPNQIVAKARASTEIRRIQLNTQGCGALVNNGSNVTINARGRVYGIFGTVTNLAPANYGDNTRFTGYTNPTVSYVFGVTEAELKAIADHVVSTVNDLPDPIPEMSLIYIDGNAAFSAARPLDASGILFVNGNLTIGNMSMSKFSGLIYVKGTASISDGCSISGSIIAYGGLTLSRAGPQDTADIQFDANIINSVAQQICNYREIKSSYRVFTGIR